MSKDNLELWGKVEKTNPNYTKKANVGGNKITSIDPHSQIKSATEQFGTYGKDWGFKSISLDYSLATTPFKKDKTEGSYPNVKIVGKEDAYMGLVVFQAVFFYPDGEFPIINSISLFTNNAMSKIDDNFAKKVETDTLTKALSKLGFNADIFLGKYDDTRYVEEMKGEFAKENLSNLAKGTPEWDNVVKLINSSALIQTQQIEKMHNVSEDLMKELVLMMKKVIEDKKPLLTKEVYDKAVVSKVKNSIQTLLTTYRMTDAQRKGLKKQLATL